MRKVVLKTASGLVEVLIVMGIIGTTLISSMLLVSRGFVEVRNNQTEDEISGIVIQVMDKLKNSTALEIAQTEFNTLTSTSTRNFYLSGRDQLTLDTFESPTTPITSCDSNNEYNVIAKEIVDSSLTQNLCIQIQLRKQDQALNDRFIGSVVYVYTLNTETLTSKLDFVKYNEFTVPNGLPGGTATGGGSATGSPATTGTQPTTGGSQTGGTTFTPIPTTGGVSGGTFDNNSSSTGDQTF